MAQLRTVTCHIWDHTVLPAIRHKWTHLDLTTAMQAATRCCYPGGMEGWVDLVDLIAPRPGVEPATFWSRVQRSTNATTKTTFGKRNVYFTYAWCHSSICTYTAILSLKSTSVSSHFMLRWFGGIVVRAPDLWSKGREFDSTWMGDRLRAGKPSRCVFV